MPSLDVQESLDRQWRLGKRFWIGARLSKSHNCQLDTSQPDRRHKQLLAGWCYEAGAEEHPV